MLKCGACMGVPLRIFYVLEARIGAYPRLLVKHSEALGTYSSRSCGILFTVLGGLSRGREWWECLGLISVARVSQE